MKLRLTSVFFAVGMVLSACSATSSDSESTVATTTMPPATSTTIPTVSAVAVKAWKMFTKSFDVVDVSEVSTGDCGARAMLITEESLTFYWWDGVRWNDDSSKLLGGKGALPIKVYSHDFTNDGVTDFFVAYEEKKDGPREKGRADVRLILCVSMDRV